MRTTDCKKCGHGINIHSDVSGCMHIDDNDNYCACWNTPQNIAEANMAELEKIEKAAKQFMVMRPFIESMNDATAGVLLRELAAAIQAAALLGTKEPK